MNHSLLSGFSTGELLREEKCGKSIVRFAFFSLLLLQQIRFLLSDLSPRTPNGIRSNKELCYNLYNPLGYIYYFLVRRDFLRERKIIVRFPIKKNLIVKTPNFLFSIVRFFGFYMQLQTYAFVRFHKIKNLTFRNDIFRLYGNLIVRFCKETDLTIRQRGGYI